MRIARGARLGRASVCRRAAVGWRARARRRDPGARPTGARRRQRLGVRRRHRLGGGGSAPGQPVAIPPSEDPERDLKDFSAYVFTDAQKTWEQTFRRDGQPYERAQLVLYRDGVATGCGRRSSRRSARSTARRPERVPRPQLLRRHAAQLGAGGDFAWAYVIAHEVGHHVQQQLGTSSEVRRLSARNRRDANELSVRLELQADCYAGVWAHTVYKQGDLEKGDVARGDSAPAGAVGDDRLQRRPAERSTRTDSPTAPRSNGGAGSRTATRAAIRPPATPSPRGGAPLID